MSAVIRRSSRLTVQRRASTAVDSLDSRASAGSSNCTPPSSSDAEGGVPWTASRPSSMASTVTA